MPGERRRPDAGDERRVGREAAEMKAEAEAKIVEAEAGTACAMVEAEITHAKLERSWYELRGRRCSDRQSAQEHYSPRRLRRPAAGPSSRRPPPRVAEGPQAMPNPARMVFLGAIEKNSIGTKRSPSTSRQAPASRTSGERSKRPIPSGPKGWREKSAQLRQQFFARPMRRSRANASAGAGRPRRRKRRPSRWRGPRVGGVGCARLGEGHESPAATITRSTSPDGRPRGAPIVIRAF